MASEQNPNRNQGQETPDKQRPVQHNADPQRPDPQNPGPYNPNKAGGRPTEANRESDPRRR